MSRLAVIVLAMAVFASWPMATALHEISHALGAKIAGLLPVQMRVGTKGRVMLRLHIGRTECLVHSQLFGGGDTSAIALRSRPRASWLLFALAGPLGSVLVGVLAIAWSTNVVVLGFAGANLLEALGTLTGRDGADFVRCLRPSWKPSKATVAQVRDPNFR